MFLTLGQAAKAAGKSKGTIFNALKSGKISGQKNEAGDYQIDPAELHRVFPSEQEKKELLEQGSAIRIIGLNAEIEKLHYQLAAEQQAHGKTARLLETVTEERSAMFRQLTGPDSEKERHRAEAERLIRAEMEARAEAKRLKDEVDKARTETTAAKQAAAKAKAEVDRLKAKSALKPWTWFG